MKAGCGEGGAQPLAGKARAGALRRKLPPPRLTIRTLSTVVSSAGSGSDRFAYAGWRHARARRISAAGQ